MMETPKADSGEQKPDGNNPPKPPIKEDVKSTPPNETKDSNQRKETQTINSEPVRIIIEKDKTGNGAAIASNIIAAFALIAACIAIYYNYLLYDKTIEANQTSKDALQLNRDQFEQSKRDNQRNRNDQEQREEEAATEATNKSIEEQRRFDSQFALQQKATQAQIDAFKETQSEFRDENEPYIQIRDITLYDSVNGKYPYIYFGIYNEGKSTVKVIGYKYQVGLMMDGVDTNAIMNILKNKPFRPFNLYVTTTTPSGEKFPLGENLIPEMYEAIRNDKKTMFFAGEYKFSNYIKPNGKSYIFIAIIRGFNQPYFTMLKND